MTPRWSWERAPSLFLKNTQAVAHCQPVVQPAATSVTVRQQLLTWMPVRHLWQTPCVLGTSYTVLVIAARFITALCGSAVAANREPLAQRLIQGHQLVGAKSTLSLFLSTIPHFNLMWVPKSNVSRGMLSCLRLEKFTNLQKVLWQGCNKVRVQTQTLVNLSL